LVCIVDILKALSDDKAFVLYNTIALADGDDAKFQIRKMGIRPHQYYSRIKRLTKVGLVKRENGKHVTTALGNVVYDSLMTIGKALDHYWILKAIESFQASSAIDSKDYVSNLIEALIEDSQIKKILRRHRGAPQLKSITGL
jgi:hypothetical protein